MKPYALGCLLIALLMVMLGWVLPYLYSANDNTLVCFAFLLTFALIPVSFWIGKGIWTSPQVQSLLTNLKE